MNHLRSESSQQYSEKIRGRHGVRANRRWARVGGENGYRGRGRRRYGRAVRYFRQHRKGQAGRGRIRRRKPEARGGRVWGRRLGEVSTLVLIFQLCLKVCPLVLSVDVHRALRKKYNRPRLRTAYGDGKRKKHARQRISFHRGTKTLGSPLNPTAPSIRKVDRK